MRFAPLVLNDKLYTWLSDVDDDGYVQIHAISI